MKFGGKAGESCRRIAGMVSGRPGNLLEGVMAYRLTPGLSAMFPGATFSDDERDFMVAVAKACGWRKIPEAEREKQ